MLMISWWRRELKNINIWNYLEHLKWLKKKKSQPRETFKLILYKLFPSTNLLDSTPSRRLAGFLNFCSDRELYFLKKVPHSIIGQLSLFVIYSIPNLAPPYPLGLTQLSESKHRFVNEDQWIHSIAAQAWLDVKWIQKGDDFGPGVQRRELWIIKKKKKKGFRGTEGG